MDLKEAEDIKKRWQEYTEELYKKDLHDPDNHDGVITHLELDILECEVKWVLESVFLPINLVEVIESSRADRRHFIYQNQLGKTEEVTATAKVKTETK